MDNLNFNDTVEKYTTSTPGHADEFNKRQDKLLENDKYLKTQLAETTKIVVSETDIPMLERKEGTFYCIVTDKTKTITNENIKVSPIMGLKIEE